MIYSFIHLLESTLGVVQAYNSVQNVIETLEDVKEKVSDYHAKWYKSAVELAEKINVTPKIPRIAASMRHHSNIPAENEEIYFRRNLTIPVLDEVIFLDPWP